MRTIEGFAQHYAWGDPHAIPEILGRAADGQPWAEWWLGTHPAGASTLSDGSPLAGASGPLPYLLKLLAAAQALSLQTHPDAQQAAEGFARGAYTDPNAKPEMLCALSPFDALCGFRPIPATVALLRDLGLDELATTLHGQGLRSTVTALYRGEIDHRAASELCRGQHTPEAQLVTRLAQRYPDDPSVAVTLLLNRVQLQPGEALFLGPGNLHAYLSGVGVEVMGASDNVIRGGLTTKAVDVDELLSILRFEELADPVLAPVLSQPGQWRYPTPDAPFELWRFDIADTMTHTATGRELLLCTDGDSGALHRGAAAYLAPGDTITLTGRSTVFCVTDS
ncbi:MAG: mannose-6-phosphate isomerase, class I [Actinomycetia bacterium]|nr:mannose-6-phosphate isomerase, class I [Actinomycetes bacterium]